MSAEDQTTEGDEAVITDADVVNAEEDAAEAAGLVDALEERVRAGDESVTVDQIDAQEKLSRFARLRAEATRRKAERSKVALRLRNARALHDEINEYGAGIGTKLADKLRAVQVAEQEFVALADEHDAKVTEWVRRAVALDIPAHDGSPRPPEEDGRVALGNGFSAAIVAGRRYVQRAEGEEILKRYKTASHPEEIIAVTQQLDAETPESEATHFYRNLSGAITALDHPLPDWHIQRDHLTKISRKEAWGK